MSNNPAGKRHVPTNQHEQSSVDAGLEVGRGQVMSSQRLHENRSRNDGYESSTASNPVPRGHTPTNQHEQLSVDAGLEVGSDQVMSSQRIHENRSRHDGYESSAATNLAPRKQIPTNQHGQLANHGGLGVGRGSTRGGSTLGSFFKMSSYIVQGGAGYLQPGEERRNKKLQRRSRDPTDSSGFQDEDAFTPSNEYQGRGEKHLRERDHQLQQLQEQNDQQAKQISELISDIEKEVKKSEEIKQSADKMIYTMENRELSIGKQDSDEEIKFHFQSLIGQIRTWSIPFAQIRQDARAYSPEAIEEFRKVSPCISDFEHFLQTPKNLRLLVRGYVGFAIAESFFRTFPYAPGTWPPGKDVWMDRELAHGFASIETSLFDSDRNLISDRDLHDWRAFTAGLISRLDTNKETDEGTETCIIACNRRIMSLVANWVAAEDQGKLEDGLWKILSDAVKLSQTLRCQRAFWSVRHAGSSVNSTSIAENGARPLYFDEGTMDDKFGDEDSDGRNIRTSSPKIVEIVISPSMWKCGNTDGEGYDVDDCVERFGVKCKRPSSPQRP